MLAKLLPGRAASNNTGRQRGAHQLVEAVLLYGSTALFQAHRHEPLQVLTHCMAAEALESASPRKAFFQPMAYSPGRRARPLRPCGVAQAFSGDWKEDQKFFSASGICVGGKRGLFCRQSLGMASFGPNSEGEAHSQSHQQRISGPHIPSPRNRIFFVEKQLEQKTPKFHPHEFR